MEGSRTPEVGDQTHVDPLSPSDRRQCGTLSAETMLKQFGATTHSHQQFENLHGSFIFSLYMISRNLQAATHYSSKFGFQTQKFHLEIFIQSNHSKSFY